MSRPEVGSPICPSHEPIDPTIGITSTATGYVRECFSHANFSTEEKSLSLQLVIAVFAVLADKRQELRYLHIHFVLRPSDHSLGVTLSGKLLHQLSA